MPSAVAAVTALLTSWVGFSATSGRAIALPDSTRQLHFSVTLAGVTAASGLSPNRFTQLAAAEAADPGLRLLPFDFGTALVLPDTLLVLAIRVGPEAATHSIDVRWLVPRSQLVAHTKHTHAPLRLACVAGTSEGLMDVRADSGAVARSALEARYTEVVRQALACFRRET